MLVEGCIGLSRSWIVSHPASAATWRSTILEAMKSKKGALKDNPARSISFRSPTHDQPACEQHVPHRVEVVVRLVTGPHVPAFPMVQFLVVHTGQRVHVRHEV